MENLGTDREEKTQERIQQLLQTVLCYCTAINRNIPFCISGFALVLAGKRKSQTVSVPRGKEGDSVPVISTSALLVTTLIREFLQTVIHWSEHMSLTVVITFIYGTSFYLLCHLGSHYWQESLLAASYLLNYCFVSIKRSHPKLKKNYTK